MKNLILSAMAVLVASAFEVALAGEGGTAEGNGGDAVVCFFDAQTRDYVDGILHANRKSYNPIPVFEEDTVRAQVESVTAFDHFEYTRPLGFPPTSRTVLTPGADYKETLETVLARLEAKSSFGRQLRDYGKQYDLSKWRAVPGVPEVDDSGESNYLPRKCLLVQVALRRSGGIAFDSYLFGRMGALDQATLVLHEWFYALALDNQYVANSKPVRELMGLFISKDEFEKLTADDLQKRLTRFGIDEVFQGPIDYEVNGQKVIIEASSLGADGKVAAGLLSGTLSLWGEMTAQCAGCRVSFYKSTKQIQTIDVGTGPVTISWGSSRVELERALLEYHDNGVPKSLMLKNIQSIPVGKKTYRAYGRVTLYPNGTIADFYPDDDETFDVVGAKADAAHVYFNPQGQLIKIHSRRNVVINTRLDKLYCTNTDEILLYPNGSLRGCHLDIQAKIRVGKKVVEIAENSFELYSNGSAKSVDLAYGGTFRTGRRTFELNSGSTLFYRSGRLKKASISSNSPVSLQWKGAAIRIYNDTTWDSQGRITSGQLFGSIIIDGRVYKSDETITFDPPVW